MSESIHFEPFRLDLDQGRLWHRDTPVAVRPKTFAVLVYLASHDGELVTKRDLLDAVWTDVSVTEDMPRISVRELRHVLGDDARAPRYIETVHGRGYRFIGTGHSTSVEMVPAAIRTVEDIFRVGREAELESLSLLVSAMRDNDEITARHQTALLQEELAQSRRCHKLSRESCDEALARRLESDKIARLAATLAALSLALETHDLQDAQSLLHELAS